MQGNNPLDVLVLPAMCQAHLRLFNNSAPAPRIRMLPRIVKMCVPGPPVLGRAVPARFGTVSMFNSSLKPTFILSVNSAFPVMTADDYGLT